jgi:hypothetical protein
MNAFRQIVATGLFAFICLSIAGCYVPVTYETTGTANLASPYDRTEISVEKGVLHVLIADQHIKDNDFRRMQLVSAELTTDSGQRIPLKVWTKYYGLGVTYLFKFADNGYDGNNFDLNLVVTLDGKTSTISGHFGVKSHTKIVNMLDELNG